MLRIGIIGVSRRGRMPIDYLPRELAVLNGIAEIDPEIRRGFEREFPGVFTTADYRELLGRADIDAVFVMVRDFLHEEMAVAALEAGKTVFLEKPMAISLESCDRILETAYRTGSKLFIGHNMRYMPFVRKMKEIIDSGIIGEIEAVWVRHFINYGSCYFRHWCAEQKNCNGLLLQKGSHDIDIIHWLAGGNSARVVGMGKLSVYNRTISRLAEGEAPDRTRSWSKDCWPPLELDGLQPNLDVEDHNMVMMTLDNGVQANYMQCMYTPDSERNYTFIGTHGRIENIGDTEDCEIHVWTKRGKRRSPDIIYRLEAEEGTHGGADPLVVRDFVEFALGHKAATTNPLAARYAVAAGAMAHESMRNGNTPRDIPPLPDDLAEYFVHDQNFFKFHARKQVGAEK